MRERGHVVQAAGEVWSGLPASSLPQHGVPTSTMSFPSVLWLRRLIRQFRPDVVHAHWMPFATLAMLAGAHPLVAQAWGSDIYLAGRRHRLELRATLRRTTVAMTDSADLVEEARALRAGVAPDNARELWRQPRGFSARDCRGSGRAQSKIGPVSGRDPQPARAEGDLRPGGGDRRLRSRARRVAERPARALARRRRGAARCPVARCARGSRRLLFGAGRAG